MRIIVVSISKTEAENVQATEVVGNLTNSLLGAEVLHIQKFINARTIISSQILDIAANIKTKLRSSLYTQIGLLQQNHTSVEEIDAIENAIVRNGCIGTSLRPIRFKAGISGIEQHAISADFFLATMHNTMNLLKPAANEPQLEAYRFWIQASDFMRTLALNVGLQSSVSLVLFDKANFPDDHIFLRLNHFPSANVIHTGRRLTSRNCSMPDNWLENFIQQVQKTTAPDGKVVFYLPRGIPQSFNARNFFTLADRLHAEGFGMHISTAQEHFAGFLEYTIGSKPGVKVAHIVADNAEEAATINARDIKPLHWSYTTHSTYRENSILEYIQMTLFILLLSKFILTILQRLTHQRSSPKLRQ